jgi:glutathione synthase
VGRLERFGRDHGSIVLKPLNDCSGRGIVKLGPGGECEERRRLIGEAVTGQDGKGRYALAQKYLTAVDEGDKRVYLVGGEPVGIVNRTPRPGNFLANIHQGAKVAATQLEPREELIIHTIAPFLREHGILLAGADFIGGYLTELNITSPSAIRQINQVSGEQVERKIVDAMLERMGRDTTAVLKRQSFAAKVSTGSSGKRLIASS